MMLLEMRTWWRFSPKVQERRIKFWLKNVRASSQHIFAQGMLGAHTGRIRVKASGVGLHQASVNRPQVEYPANDSGQLLASMKSVQARRSVTLGTNVEYSKFLRDGRGGMARRKMSDNALVEGAREARPHSRGWVAFQKGKSR